MSEHTTPATAAAKLARFAADLTWTGVPEPVRRKLKATLLHNLAMALAGRRLAGVAVELALAMDRARAGGGARLLVDGTRVGVDAAVIANAAMMHARTQDDTHLGAQTHLGATTLPALLAVGEEDAASGEQFLLAMLCAYEVAAVGTGRAAAATARGVRPSTAFGTPAAAVGVARLLGGDADVIQNAAAIAASFGAGTGQTWVAGTEEWQYQLGVAGRNGVLAARLAHRGVTGAPDAFEGAAGLLTAITGTSSPPLQLDRLGQNWSILDVTYKPYPVCVINQRPVELVARMVGHLTIDPSSVEEVRVTLPPEHAEYPGTDAYAPFSGVGAALMSAPQCVAIALRDGTVTRAALEDLDDRTVVELARRVNVVSDTEMVAGDCHIAIVTGGTVHTSDEVEDPGRFDWDFDEVLSRVERLAPEIPLPLERIRALADMIADLENRSVRELVEGATR